MLCVPVLIDVNERAPAGCGASRVPGWRGPVVITQTAVGPPRLLSPQRRSALRGTGENAWQAVVRVCLATRNLLGTPYLIFYKQ